jgi:hypothetical protein
MKVYGHTRVDCSSQQGHECGKRILRKAGGVYLSPWAALWAECRVEHVQCRSVDMCGGAPGESSE